MENLKNLKVHRNGRDGVQIEWRGVLFSLQMNKFHGISGSVAKKRKDGKIMLLCFHGSHPEQPMPVSFHEQMMEPDGTVR